MTLEKWTEEVTEDFTEAGFTVQQEQGFPLVKMPRGSISEAVRLLKVRGRWAVEKRIYAEGMFLLPVGTPCDPTRASDSIGSGSVSMLLNLKKTR